MTIKIKKQPSGESLRATIEQRAEVDLSACYQCQKCSIGCPVAGLVSSPPSEIIRRLQLGAGDELLQSDLVWTCLSCETCYARCPNEINFAGIIDALRAVALEKGMARPEGNAPLFNRLFLDTVKAYGRSYDLRMIAAYKLGAGKLMDDMDKFPTMLKKGKMAVLPPSGADKSKVKKIFAGIAKSKGKSQ
ncbi:MAG: 4Fe-4S dicluster domain-containing protein [Dehalococcoidales bacterium]